ESLKRLGTDYIDVYFAHVDDAATPLEESLTAFSRLVEAGKVRSIGASNYTADRLRSALEVSEQKALPRYEVLQPRYNLHDRQDFESGLGKVAQEQEIGVVCYFALASGFLTGKYRSAEEAAESNRAGMLANYFDDRGMRILSAMNKIAEELAATPAQIALAWLMARPGVTAPIASATSVEQLDDIMKAARLELPEEVLGRLEEASA
ncbi:MAG TPA: aldo/keto reductase, partial [Kiloniellales bacterium]|nr:aldo/keto reductase [Kiloniellales bacterium]